MKALIAVSLLSLALLAACTMAPSVPVTPPPMPLPQTNVFQAALTPPDAHATICTPLLPQIHEILGTIKVAANFTEAQHKAATQWDTYCGGKYWAEKLAALGPPPDLPPPVRPTPVLSRIPEHWHSGTYSPYGPSSFGTTCYTSSTSYSSSINCYSY